MSEEYWLGPTYEFHCGQWVFLAGIHAESGRLEWLLRRVEAGIETASHSFVLDPHATAAELEAVLGELSPVVAENLVSQVNAQSDPRLLSSAPDRDDGLA